MATKKIPISFNSEDQEFIKELINLMSISNTYGDVPKAIKFGIRLAVSTIKNPEKVYTTLNDDEMDLFFSSVSKYEKVKKLLRQSAKLQESAEKV